MGYLIKIVVITCILLKVNSPFSQEKLSIGLGGNMGFKNISGEGGFVLDLKLWERINFSVGDGSNKYHKSGYFFNVDIFPINGIFQPFVGLAFNHLKGKRSYFKDGLGVESEFLVPPSDNIVYCIGARFQWGIESDKAIYFGKTTSISLYLSYRDQKQENVAEFISGDRNEDIEKSINKRIGEGLGFGLKVVAYIVFID